MASPATRLLTTTDRSAPVTRHPPQRWPLLCESSGLPLPLHQQMEEAAPRLQGLAPRQDMLDLALQQRSDGDEPPSYYSAMMSLDNPPRMPLPTYGDQVDHEFEQLIRPPLSENELLEMQLNLELLEGVYRPGRRYKIDADHERSEQRRSPWIQARPGYFRGRAGDARAHVYIRHQVKKRWEMLGVWNPEWGIPGRVDPGPRDYPEYWKWKWQGDAPYDGTHRDNQRNILIRPEHPTSRRVRLREGMRRGERGPLPPLCHLVPDASKAAAEAFITSRPWYTWEMDMAEERTRRRRLPMHMAHSGGNGPRVAVASRWEEAGDIPWKWKWGHESPEPDPGELDEDTDLTPSEIDALEAIPPPTPPPLPPPPPVYRYTPGSLFGRRPPENIFGPPSPSGSRDAPAQAVAVDDLGDHGDQCGQEGAVSTAPALPLSPLRPLQNNAIPAENAFDPNGQPPLLENSNP